MHGSYRNRLYLIGVLVLLVALVAQADPWHRVGQNGSARSGVPSGLPMLAPGSNALSGQGSTTDTAPSFVVGRSLYNDTSPALRDIPPAPYSKSPIASEMPEPPSSDQLSKALPMVNDPVAQRNFGFSPLAIATPSVNFEGVNNRNGLYPPDTNGDVGPNHYVQIVNASLQMWSKSGVSLFGPVNNSTIWSGFSSPCSTRNDGDPIVLYDSIADRWLISQFTVVSPYGECVAISTSPDPTGSYYRYFFQLSTTEFYDYPKLGVWPDGYYMGANRYANNLKGPSAIVINRSAMLAGQTATYQQFNLGSNRGALFPSDLDGTLLPLPGSPNYFVARDSTALQMWKFHVDWSNSANSTFSGPTNLPVAAYNTLCCIPQPGTTVTLASLSSVLMFRLAYRNFGDHESLVINHTVSVGGIAGVRWYEIRNPNGTPSIYQQGTYQPDSTHRWMGSVAMDRQGNMAIVYSASSSSVYPSIRYTGRLTADPLGQMPQGEGTLIAGSGSQTGTASRWGDYANISVDPADDCTFWMTTEYMQTTSTLSWQTRVGAFKFPGCTSPGPTATPTNTPVPPTPADTPTLAPPTGTPILTEPTETTTPLPPTNTPAPAPPTNTPVPPTATPTSDPNPSDFSISISPSGNTLVRPGSVQYSVTLTSLNGFSGSVSLSVSGLPSKTTASFNPPGIALAPNGTGMSTLTVAGDAGGPTGTFTLTIAGTSGATSHSQNATLVVTR